MEENQQTMRMSAFVGFQSKIDTIELIDRYQGLVDIFVESQVKFVRVPLDFRGLGCLNTGPVGPMNAIW